MATFTHNSSTVNESSPITHGIYHLANGANGYQYEIQRSNNFEFIVMDIDGLGGVDNAQEVLRLAVSEAFVPHFSQSTIEVKRGNNTIKYAGTPKFDSGSIKIVDYIGLDTKSIITAWQNKCYDIETEKVGLIEDYKKTAYLVEYTPDYQVVRRWKLIGCWPSSVKEGTYSASSNEKKEIDITIEYDAGWIDTTDSITTADTELLS